MSEQKRPHLSHTQLNMWLRCPRQYEFRYWKGLKIPPAGAMIQGSCYHEALARNFTHKLDTHEDMPVPDILDYFSDTWAAKLASEPEVDWEGDDPGRLKDEGVRLTKMYREQKAPEVQPFLVEEKLVLPLDGQDLDFVGIVDLVCLDDLVVDHKTVARTPTQADVDQDIQATAYAFLLQRDIDFAIHAAVKNKTPKLAEIRTRRTQADIAWWLDMVQGVWRQMQTGIAPPNPCGWHCSPAGCGYWRLCRP